MLSKSEKWVFITMGLTAVNTVLMANGIETMPNMWAKEVYQDPMLGASIGAMSGIGLGGAIGATGLIANEAIKAGINSLRNKFSTGNNNENSKKFNI